MLGEQLSSMSDRILYFHLRNNKIHVDTAHPGLETRFPGLAHRHADGHPIIETQQTCNPDDAVNP